jgi:hypothetical protein
MHLIFDTGSRIWRKSFTYLRDNLPSVTSTILNTGANELSHLSPLEQPETVAHEILKALSPASNAIQ